MQKRALVVDDSRVARMSLKKAILVHEFDVTEFASAEETLSYLKTTDDKPNIIFMDLMMVSMDGISATKQIKMIDGFADIPIVICSGNSAEIDITSAKAAGAMEILSKPPEPSTVANIIQKTNEINAPEKPQVATENTTPVADKSLMTEKVVELIEQKLMLKMQDDFRQLAEEVSRKNVTEAVENSLTGKIQKELNVLLPSVSQQLISEAMQANLDNIQSSTEQAANDVIEQRLPQAIEAATANININQQVETLLSQQEAAVQQRIAGEVQQEAMKAAEQYIDNSLAALIAPQVTLQMEQELQKQSAAAKEQVEQLESRILKLDRVVMGLGLAVIILAILLFI